jgi:Ca-activated chloride channel family protein
MPPSIVGPFVAGLSRTIGWTVLGALVARGLAFFIPNLRPTHAWTGGAFGGAVAALAFLAAATVGDVPGRLVGAALLGGLIGMMVALIESSSRVVNAPP